VSSPVARNRYTSPTIAMVRPSEGGRNVGWRFMIVFAHAGFSTQEKAGGAVVMLGYFCPSIMSGRLDSNQRPREPHSRSSPLQKHGNPCDFTFYAFPLFTRIAAKSMISRDSAANCCKSPPKVPVRGRPDFLLRLFENLRVQSELVVAGLIGGPMSRCLITSFTAADLKDCG